VRKFPWFSDIGLSYAKHFDELDAAWSEFDKQRIAILNHLSEVAIASLTSATIHGVTSPPVRSDDGWEHWWITGTWARARARGDRQSGISFGLDLDPCFENDGGGRFGFGVYVFFMMSANRYAKLQSCLADVATATGCALDYAPGKDRCACARTAWIVPEGDRFGIDAFVEEIERLPGLFRTIDDVVGTAYAKTKVQ
jgi:hypothetical protein